MTTNKTIKISALARQNNVTGKMILPVSFLDSDNVYKSATIDVESIKNFVSNNLDYVTSTDLSEAIMQIIDGAPEKLDTLKEIAEYINTDTANAAELSNKVTALENAGFLTEHQDLSHLALKTDIPSLEGYVREEDLREPNLEAYATKTFVESQGYLTEHQDLSHLALKTDIPSLDGCATKNEVAALKDVQDMLVNLATTWSKNENEPESIKGKIKAANDVQNEYIAANYALKSDIPVVPSLDGYATTDYVDEAIAGIEISGGPNLDGYATTDYVDEAIAGIEIPEVPSLDGYATTNYVDTQIGNISIPDVSKYMKMDSKNSLVGGTSCSSTHSNSLVFGNGLQSDNDNATILGNYNKKLGWNNLLLSVGNGTSSARTNVFVVQGGNEQAIHINGACKQTATWIADFGEYFEWNDGNPNNEDRIGYLVQLNNGKIELAESIDNAIGVISATCAFIGAACSLEWHNRFLRDEWGRLMTDENGNMIENPEYNPELEYIPREKRKEWDVVGLVGQVLTRQDGTLKVNGYAGCVNGVATDSDHGYRVLRIINDNIAVLLVK